VTDPWARPTANRPVVEIELTGGEPAPVRGAARRDEPPSTCRPSSRRRRVGLVVVGAALAAVVATAVTTVGGDDESSESPTTTFDTSRITTPPTLPAITLPPVTGPDTQPVDRTLPDDASPPFDPTALTVPTFDVVPDVAPDDLGAYDLLGAIAANGVGGTPMRTKLRIDGIQQTGLFRTSLDVTVSNDPTAGIDSIAVQGNVGERAELVLDRATESVFRTDNGMDGRWEQFPTDEFLVGTGTDRIDALFDSFATGPISPAAVAGGTVEPADGLVRLNGGAIARLYRVIVPVEALQPYGLLLVANVYDESIANGLAPESITFDVYVTNQPALALVTARFEVDQTVYLLQQFFDRRPANVLLELPPADAIIDGPVTGAPAQGTTVPVATVPVATSQAVDSVP
jgi:hypothetical protein